MCAGSTQRGRSEHIRLHSIPRGLLKLAIARLLRDNEMSGMDIMDTLEQQSGGAWRPSPGSIYPLLSQMEELGWIEAVAREGRTKTYRLTDLGRQTLSAYRVHQRMFRSKAKMLPRIWGLILDPRDQVSLYRDALVTLIDCVGSLTDELRARDRERLVRYLRTARERIDEILKRLESGVDVEVD